MQPDQSTTLTADLLVGISMVRNEADIIDAFVQHNLAHLDLLLVIDHQSTDDTRARLLQHQRQGKAVLLYDFTRDAFAQAECLTGLMRHAAANLGAHWVFPLDADEFIRIDTGAPLRGAMRRARDHHPVLMPWQTYVPTVYDDPGISNPIERINHRRARDWRQRYKVAVPGHLATNERCSLASGSHGLRKRGRRKPLTTQFVSGLRVAHFPVRSAQQIHDKVVNGWRALAPDPAPSAGAFGNWRDMLTRFQAQGLPTPEDLTRLALTYGRGHAAGHIVRDPLPTPGTAEAAPRHDLHPLLRRPAMHTTPAIDDCIGPVWG